MQQPVTTFKVIAKKIQGDPSMHRLAPVFKPCTGGKDIFVWANKVTTLGTCKILTTAQYGMKVYYTDTRRRGCFLLSSYGARLVLREVGEVTPYHSAS